MFKIRIQPFGILVQNQIPKYYCVSTYNIEPFYNKMKPYKQNGEGAHFTRLKQYRLFGLVWNFGQSKIPTTCVMLSRSLNHMTEVRI